jgi:hypothetical protein
MSRISKARAWAPDLRWSALDKDALYARLYAALAAHAPEAANLLPRPWEAGATQLLHPAFFNWAYAAVAKPSQALDGLEQARHYILESRGRAGFFASHIGAPIDMLPSRDSMHVTVERAIADASAIHRDSTFSIDPLSSLTSRQVAVVRAAFGVLRDCWPAMFEEIVHFVQQCCFFDSHRIIGFVDFRSHGSIFLRRETIDEPVKLAEEIVHESSHVRLNAIHAVERLFENDSEPRYSTPLRREKRHMFGVFHQLFVLCRLAQFYRSLPPGVARDRHAAVEQYARDAFEVVDRHAILTPAGCDMVESMRAHLWAADGLRVAS